MALASSPCTKHSKSGPSILRFAASPAASARSSVASRPESRKCSFGALISSLTSR